ncbi:hypothetical protein [Cupriavidus necator]
MSTTFHGNPQLKAEILSKINNHAAAGTLIPTPFAWRDGKGSVVGCAIESDDLSLWVSNLGLPKFLALLIDAIATNQPSREQAIDAGRRSIDAIPVGADLEQVSGKFIVGLLQQTEALPQLAALRQKAIALQQQLLDGMNVEPAQWREARREAMALSDGLAPKSREALLSQALEASLWNTASSPTAVSDMLRPWAALYGLRTLEEWGWTADDEANVHARLKEMHDRFFKDNPDSKGTVFQHYAKEYPQEEERLRERIKVERNGTAEGYSAALNLLLAIVGNNSQVVAS